MGRVFNFEAVARGKIPTPEDFAVARNVFEARMEELVEKELVSGAFIFGSVAIGAANRRSDFDAFVAVPDNHIDNYQAVKSAVNETMHATRGKVSIVPIIQSVDALLQGRHEMDRLFGEHLTSPHRGIIGMDPAHQIKYPEDSASHIMAGYLAAKKRRLTTAYTECFNPSESDLTGIQRMLELPVAIGRKALQAYADVDPESVAVEKSADKRAVLDAAETLMTRFGLEEGFEDIQEMNRTYELLLDEAMLGNIGLTGYNEVLNDLHSQLPHALIWIDQVETEFLPSLS